MRIRVSYWYDTETDQLVAGAGFGHDYEVAIGPEGLVLRKSDPLGPSKDIKYYPTSTGVLREVGRRAAAELQGTGEAHYVGS